MDTITNHALIYIWGAIFHNYNICTCSRHSNDHQKKYYRHCTEVFVRNSFSAKVRFCSSKDFPSFVNSSLCGGYLYANIGANALAILNNMTQWCCLGEKSLGKLILTFFKKIFKTAYLYGYAGPCRVKRHCGLRESADGSNFWAAVAQEVEQVVQ